MIRTILAILLAASPALAQETSDDCKAMFDLVTDAIDSFVAENAGVSFEAKAIALADGACRAEGFSFSDGSTFTLKTSVAVWSVDGFDRFKTDNLPPYSLSVRFVDAVVIEPESAIHHYLGLDPENPDRTDAKFSYQWDPETLTTVVRLADTSSLDGSTIEAGITVHGFDIETLAKMQLTIGQMLITDVTLDLQSNGHFDYDLLQTVLPLDLAIDADVAAMVAEAKSNGADHVANLPSPPFNDAPKDALTRYIADFPNPRGLLSVAYSADPGFAVLPYLVFGVAMFEDQTFADALIQLWAAIEDDEIAISYDP